MDDVRSDQTLRALLDLAPVTIARFDPGGRFLYANRACAALLGLETGQIVGRTIRELIAPASVATVWEQHVVRVMDTGSTIDVEVVVSHEPRRIYRTHFVPEQGADGRPIAVLAYATDVTERKAADEAVRLSEEKFAKAFHATPDAININRLSDGLFVDINPGFQALTGYARDEVIGRTSADVNIWADPADRDRLVAHLARDGQMNDLKAPFRLRSGTVRVGIMSARVITLDGEPHIISVTRDIHDREQAEETLRQQVEELAALAALGQAVNATLSLDQTIVAALDGMCRAVNPDVAFFFLREDDGLVLKHVMPGSSRARLGTIPDHRVGECMCGLAVKEKRSLYSADIFGDPRCTWEECKRAGMRSFAALPLINGDDVIGIVGLASDTSRDFEGRARFLETMTGQISVALANARLYDEVHRELADRQRAEAEQGRLQAQLLQAQKMESVGRLAGGVAHDFNNMLSVILGHAELAADTTGSEAINEHLEQILSAGRRSADLTRQLLAFARKQAISPRVLDLNDTMSGMLKMLQRLIGEEIALVWRPGPSLWPVVIDPSQVDQILANLVVNARDAMDGVGTLAIETANTVIDEAYGADPVECSPGEHVLLAVSDTGAGMTREVLDHIFEPFFTTKASGEGTGLGLSTVYGIVRQNNGFINAYSEPGAGTTMKIWLPRAATAAALDRSGATAVTPTGTETILLVEDEDAVLELGRSMLTRLGYRVLAARSPLQAVQLIAELGGSIDLLISDVVMPEMNGRELAARLTLSLPSLRCLFVSGYTGDIISHRGVLDGSVHFLQKPFSLPALAQAVRRALGD
ncbi:MAG TPA: PAS domain S-box protein [Vicinamibacterales bacterium]|jgi:PAS domain S-box-containing protein